MEQRDGPGKVKTRETFQESAECNDPNQPDSMETVWGGGQANESRPLRHNRRTGDGFFSGEADIDETVITELLRLASKNLQNARARIEEYTREEAEYLEQVNQLKNLLEIKRNSSSQTEEE